MTGTEYFHAARDFHKTHKAAVDRIMGALFEESLARQRNAKLVESPVKDAIENYRKLLVAMAELSHEVATDA